MTYALRAALADTPGVSPVAAEPAEQDRSGVPATCWTSFSWCGACSLQTAQTITSADVEAQGVKAMEPSMIPNRSC